MKAARAITALPAKRPRVAAVPAASEHDEQCALIQWFDLQYPALRRRLAAVPNAGKMPAHVGAKMNREGRRKGYPDLQLLVPVEGYHGLIIEMKRVKGGTIEAEQLEWLEWFAEMGFRAVVCKGAEAARQVVREYLAGYQGKKASNT